MVTENSTMDVAYEGVEVLERLGKLDNFNRLLVEQISPFLQGSLLEVGAGTGNLSQFLPNDKGLLLSDLDPALVERLSQSFSERQNTNCDRLDISCPIDVQRWLSQHGSVDSVICMNVMEHIENDTDVLSHLKGLLNSGGRAVVLVPQFMSLYGSYDEMVGHFQRYEKSELAQKLAGVGFKVKALLDFNTMSIPGWWLNAVLLRSKQMPTWQLKLVDRLFPLIHPIERKLKLPGMSVIAVGEKP